MPSELRISDLPAPVSRSHRESMLTKAIEVRMAPGLIEQTIELRAQVLTRAMASIASEAVAAFKGDLIALNKEELVERVAAHVVKLALDHLNESNRGAPAIKAGEELEYQPCALVSEGVLLCHPKTFEKVMEYMGRGFEMKDGKEPFDHSTLR